jgi:hypothetical protein
MDEDHDRKKVGPLLTYIAWNVDIEDKTILLTKCSLEK